MGTHRFTVVSVLAIIMAVIPCAFIPFASFSIIGMVLITAIILTIHRWRSR